MFERGFRFQLLLTTSNSLATTIIDDYYWRGNQTDVNNPETLDRSRPNRNRKKERGAFWLISTRGWSLSLPSSSSPILQTQDPLSSSDGLRHPLRLPDSSAQTQRTLSAIPLLSRQTTRGRLLIHPIPSPPRQPSRRHPLRGWQVTTGTICGLGPQTGQEITLCRTSPGTPIRSHPLEPPEEPPRSISRLITISKTLPSIPLSPQL